MSRIWTYRATRHDLDKPWLILETTELQSVELPAEVNLWAWVIDRWPKPEWTVTLDPPGQEHDAVIDQLNRDDS